MRRGFEYHLDTALSFHYLVLYRNMNEYQRAVELFPSDRDPEIVLVFSNQTIISTDLVMWFGTTILNGVTKKINGHKLDKEL